MSSGCFLSPNYPNDYGLSEACTIRVLRSTTLQVNAFETEHNYDKLTMGGTDFSGFDGPSGVFVAAGTTITWSSDYSVAKPGFEICGTSRMRTASLPRKGSPLGGVLFGSTCTRQNNGVPFQRPVAAVWALIL